MPRTNSQNKRANNMLRSFSIIRDIAKILDLPPDGLIPLLELPAIQKIVVEAIDKELES